MAGKTAQGISGAGDRLRQARELHDLNQGQLAALLGVRRETVTDWEGDKQGIGMAYLSQISALLGVSTDFIIHGPRAAIPPEKIAAALRAAKVGKAVE